MDADKRPALGQILHAMGVLPQDRLERVVGQGLLGDDLIGRLLVRLGWVSCSDVAQALAVQAGTRYFFPKHLEPRPAALEELSVAHVPAAGGNVLVHLRRLRALPVEGDAAHTFAVATLGDAHLIPELERMAGEPVEVVVTDEDFLAAMLLGEDLDPERKKAFLDENRRERTRTPCFAEIESYYSFDLSDPENQATLCRGEVLDLSEKGVRMRGTLPVENRRELAEKEADFLAVCVCAPPLPATPIRTVCKMRWIERTDGYDAQLGASWGPTSQRDRLALDELLVTLWERRRDGFPPSALSQDKGVQKDGPPPPPPEDLEFWGSAEP